jgi:uncharacterized protein involved in outer membrane biogenesis
LALQTTLLGLAIAIILALVAALVGPLLVDWGGYRSIFEAEATRLVGLDVRVTGAIDARLLPSPQLTLHDIEIGRAGDEKVRARSLGIEFALGPLMRGEWRASEMHLAGPQLTLGLDAAGHLQAPNLDIGFNPDALTIDRLSIEDGKLTLTDAANGGSVTLNHLWFNGVARSLLGPVRGEGAASVGGDLYPFRLAAGRLGDDGKLKLHVNVDPVSHPLSAEVDGALSLAAGAPRFEGSLSLTRPVGIAARGAGTLSQPWRVSGKIKATPASALMQKFEFQYGSQDKGFKLTGVADFKFGKQPRFDGVLSGGQIDLDRALAEGDGRRMPPAAAISRLAQLAAGAFRPKIPIQIGIGIDQATLGGDAVQNLRGDISTDAKGWSLDRFEFRAPGFTQVRVSGHLAVEDERVAFAGPAELKTNDAKALTAWLAGHAAVGQGDLRPLSLRGELTLGNDRIAVERLTAEFDRKPITGNFAYVFAAGKRPARLDAALKAPELDLDAALAFGNALIAGSAISRPHDMSVAADIGHATIAGLDARDASARLKVDAAGLQIDRLSVADLGGAAFSASGRIVTSPSPQGSMRVDLDAPDMTPVLALLSRFAPKAANALRAGAAVMVPAKLHGELTMQGASPPARAKLAVEGSLGKVRLALNGEISGELISLKAGDVTLSGKLNSDDGKLLAAVLGLDRIVMAQPGAGALTFDASGPMRGALRVNVALKTGGLEANAMGTASPLADKPTADLRVAVAHADVAPLRGAGAGQAALPITFAGRVALAGPDLALSDIEAKIAGTALRGKLGLTLTTPYRLRGEIDTDRVDGASLIAAAIGMPAPAESGNAAWHWSDEPFAAGLFGDYEGRIAFKTRSLDVLPQVAAREFGAKLNFARQEFSLDDMAGDIAGGRLTGRLSFHAAEDGLHARAKVALAGADVNALLPSGARPPVTGTLALAGEVEGAGLSPVALIGSLHGSGQFTLSDTQFAGLDPRAFDAVTHAVDQGLAIDPARIADVVSKALQSGRLAVKGAQGDLAISAGQVRLAKFSADSNGAQLSVAGNLDFISGTIDGRLMLSGAGELAGSRPDIFMALKGPLAAPERSIDVSALTGWLTLRAIENQTKQLRAIERAPPPAPPPLPRPKSEMAPVKPAPAPLSRQRSAASKNEAAGAPLDLATKRAPALPPPVVVAPLPAPGRAAQPEASAAGPQR